jgi:serine/threonine protein kinase
MHFVFTTETRIIYIMNFVRGGDLLMHLMQLGQFTEEMTKFYLCQLIISIGYLHHNNIVHRDLKLENILLEADGKIYL